MAIVPVRACPQFALFPNLGTGDTVDLNWLNVENSKSHFSLRGELAMQQIGGRVNGVTEPVLGARGGAGWKVPEAQNLFAQCWIPSGYTNFSLLAQYRIGRRFAFNVVQSGPTITLLPRYTVALNNSGARQVLMNEKATDVNAVVRRRIISGRLDGPMRANYHTTSRRYIQVTWDPDDGQEPTQVGGMSLNTLAPDYLGFMQVAVSFWKDCNAECP